MLILFWYNKGVGFRVDKVFRKNTLKRSAAGRFFRKHVVPDLVRTFRTRKYLCT